MEHITNEVVRGRDGKLYRRSAQAFIVNENGQFLGCTPCGGGNGQFLQTVQGGVERGEDPIEAAMREISEEIGLKPDDVDFVGVVVSTSGPVLPEVPSAIVNARGEVEDEGRREFRYLGKSWKKIGISGQELYPFLFFADSKVIRKVNLNPKTPDIRKEFVRVRWVNLENLALSAPPSKKQVLESITTCVYPLANAFLLSKGYPATHITSIMQQEYYQRRAHN